MSDETIVPEDEAAETEAPNLTELSMEELAALEDALVEEFNEQSQAAEFSEDTMQGLRDVVAAIEMVREEAARRVEFAQMAELIQSSSVETFAAELETDEPVEETEETVEDAADTPEFSEEETTETEDADEAPAEEFNETTPAEEANDTPDEEFAVSNEAPEATTTEEISPDGLASDTVPAEPKRKLGITASADVPGYAAGQDLDGLLEVAEALMAKRGHVRGTDRGNDGYQYLVASIQTGEYDEAHTLGNDAIINQNRVDAATQDAQSLVAGGGIKAPLTPYYELTVFGDSVRPVRDSLVGFKADRGGIRWVPSPVIGDTASGVNVYAETVDASATPYGSGKGVVTLTVGAEQSKKVDVVPRIMKVGNLMARTFPEMVSAWTKLLIAQHAREAEGNLLDYLVADSTAVSADATFGAVRSLLPQIDQLVAAYRSRHRIATSVRFRAILPFWVKDLIRTDIGRQLYGADFAVSDAQIENYFSTRGLNVSWHYDTSATTNMLFGAQSAGAMLKYPTVVEWFLFPEGTWLFLDGGTLDLGLVRDSTLNSTNDYTIFAETFEAAVRVGQQSLKVNSTLYANGSAINATAVSATAGA